MQKSPRLVVLISGTGRNLQAIIEAVKSGRLSARIAAVISNNASAPGLARAEEAGLATETVDHRAYPRREDFDAALQAAIDRHEPDLVALAGFMRILGSSFVQHYHGKLLNIHPSLLPKYQGLNTHARAIADGERWHGASVHYVTEEVDGGPVILQGRVPVESSDSAESLAERVMQDVELKIFPQALAWAAGGRLKLQGNDAWLDGRRLAEPVRLEGPKGDEHGS
jgi:phosphoribosylglycinamide formyltransferase-1